MSYGLECRDANGNISYSTEDHAYLVIGFRVVSQNSNLTFTIDASAFNEVITMVHPIEQVDPDTDSVVPNVSRSGNTVTCTKVSGKLNVKSSVMVLGR